MVTPEVLVSVDSLITFLINFNPVSAYIDPGTGGYLAASLWAMIATYLAIFAAVIAAFFSRRLIVPLKTLYKNHKGRFILITVLIIIITLSAVYLSIEDPPEFDEALSGAHIYDIDNIYPGYNLYEGKVIDSSGVQLKQWKSTHLGVIDKNGDYYAQQYYEAPTWGRYSWNGAVIWEMSMAIHHEILLTPQDTILTFTKEVHEYNERKVEFDVILELDKNGNIIDSWSTWTNLEHIHQFHGKLELDQRPSVILPKVLKKPMSIWGGEFDYYHLNSISLVPSNALEHVHPAYKPGNWIVSFRHGSMIFILDKDTKRVLWRAIYDQISNNLEGPHTPSMTSEGNIIVFDNGRFRKWSRLICINPQTLDITWEYKADDPDDFFSESQSSMQVLPNHNILVTESEKGRVFELTANKQIVWEFYHPDKQDESNSKVKEKYGQRQEIYRMVRYDKEFIDNLIRNN